MSEELIALRAEVAELRSRLDELCRFIEIVEDEEAPGRKRAAVQCSTFILTNPGNGHIQAMFCAEDDGPVLALWSDADYDKPGPKARVLLKVREDEGQVSVLGKDGTERVQLLTDEDRGVAVVFSAKAEPRALLRAQATGGAAAALRADGKPLAMLKSEDGDGGAVMTLKDSEPLRVGSKLISNKEGNFFALHGMDEQPRVLLGSHQADGGVFIMNDATGEPRVSAIVSAHASVLKVDPQKPSEAGVRLMAGEKDLAAAIDIHNAAGKTVASFGTGPDGAGFSGVNDAAGKEAAVMRVVKSTGYVEVKDLDGPGCAMMSVATGKGGMVCVYSGDGQTGGAAMLSARPEAGEFIAINAGKPRAMIGCNEAGGHVGVFAKDAAENDQPAAALSATEHGGALRIGGTESVPHVTLGSTEDGGQVAVYNDLGILRARLQNKSDGGALDLRFGGTTSAIAMATEKGGFFLVNDAAGETRACLPKEFLGDDGAEDDD